MTENQAIRHRLRPPRPYAVVIRHQGGQSRREYADAFTAIRAAIRAGRVFDCVELEAVEEEPVRIRIAH